MFKRLDYLFTYYLLDYLFTHDFKGYTKDLERVNALVMIDVGKSETS